MRTSLIMFLLIALGGCKANHHPLGLPEVKQTAVVASATSNPHHFHVPQDVTFSMKRDPFSLPAVSRTQGGASSKCDENAETENDNQLAIYPLSQLRLAGIMTVRGEHAALIELPNGSLVTKTKGQSVASNRLITDISADAIEVRESVRNSAGCLDYRRIKLAIN